MEVETTEIEDEVRRIAREIDEADARGRQWCSSKYETDLMRDGARKIDELKEALKESRERESRLLDAAEFFYQVATGYPEDKGMWGRHMASIIESRNARVVDDR